MGKKKSKGIYLSGTQVDAIKQFLIETTAMMRKARKEVHDKYPDIYKKGLSRSNDK